MLRLPSAEKIENRIALSPTPNKIVIPGHGTQINDNSGFMERKESIPGHIFTWIRPPHCCCQHPVCNLRGLSLCTHGQEEVLHLHNGTLEDVGFEWPRRTQSNQRDDDRQIKILNLELYGRLAEEQWGIFPCPLVVFTKGLLLLEMGTRWA